MRDRIKRSTHALVYELLIIINPKYKVFQENVSRKYTSKLHWTWLESFSSAIQESPSMVNDFIRFPFLVLFFWFVRPRFPDEVKHKKLLLLKWKNKLRRKVSQ